MTSDAPLRPKHHSLKFLSLDQTTILESWRSSRRYQRTQLIDVWRQDSQRTKVMRAPRSVCVREASISSGSSCLRCSLAFSPHFLGCHSLIVVQCTLTSCFLSVSLKSTSHLSGFSREVRLRSRRPHFQQSSLTGLAQLHNLVLAEVRWGSVPWKTF